jgi:hypothetical protein
MRGPVVALTAAGAFALGLTSTVIIEQAHAAQEGKAAAPTDDCWSGPAAGGAACEHVFKDGTRCVLYVRPSPVNTTASLAAMECKIT